MAGIVDIHTLINMLVQQKTSLEDLVERSLSNLYKLESEFLSPSMLHNRNLIRTTIAYTKVLYDCGQQMALARVYLLHKINLLEVRERDRNAELSVLRDWSSDDDSPGKQEATNHPEDEELSIIMDARMIKNIDLSRAALEDISKLIAEKSLELQSIEYSMDNINSPLLSANRAHTRSIPDLMPHCISGISGTGCSHMKGAARRLGVGDTRKLSPSYTEMDMSMEKEISLLPQGASDPPEAGTAVSPTLPGRPLLRESCEGTAGVDSASAPAAKAATAEVITFKEATSVAQDACMEVSPIDLVEKEKKKRKAPMISEDPIDVLQQLEDERPVKNRAVVESDGSETNAELSVEENSQNSEMDIYYSPAPRRSERIRKPADFSQPTEARLDKKKEKKQDDRFTAGPHVESDAGSMDSAERIVDSIVRRVQEEEEAPISVHSDTSLDASFSEASRNTSIVSFKNKNKKNVKSKNKKDTSVNAKKGYANKSKKKISRPEIVAKDDAQIELHYCREDWLKLDGAELGARCLDHLEELNRQRCLSSNLSGTVAGRMKDSTTVASEITKALIEKITSVGDVYGLRTENFSLREELEEIKRKNNAQNLEITALRKTIANLEREVRSLKEGFGPFPAGSYTGAIGLSKRHSTPERALDKNKKEKRVVARRFPETEVATKETEGMLSTPGCSTDDAYMRRYDWPADGDATPWQEKMDVDVPDEVINPSDINKIKLKSSSEINKDKTKSTKKVLTGAGSTGIRILENKQIVPPAYSTPNKEWLKVGRSKFPKKNKRITNTQRNDVASSDASVGVAERPAVGKPKSGRKLVRPAVVTISNKGSSVSYAEILTKARDNVSLKDLGINDTVVRRALNGAIVIEVPGPMGKQLAGSLSLRLAEVLGDEVRVTNPVATGELRIRGIDPSTTTEDILNELVTLSGSPRTDFKVSPITNMRDGMGISWITCPIETAIMIAECGMLRLGWTRVRIELMRKKPVQCYNCWRFGHVRSACRSSVSRSGLCFRCGEDGHPAKQCNAGAPKCVICSESGKEFRHRLGSPRCLDNQGFPSGIQPVRRKIPNAGAGGGQPRNY